MQTIYLDISNKGVVPTVCAKQGDVGRKFKVVLTDSGLPYYPVDGSFFSAWYSGESGEGNYTEIGNNSAFAINGNEVIVEIISQMLESDGSGVLCILLNEPNGNQVGSWNIPYLCEAVPGFNSEAAKEYYTAFSAAVEKLSDADKIVQGKLSTDGSNSMRANLSMGWFKVENMGDPETDGDAVNLGYAKKVGNPYNLLDNSDFTNPVNQRGITNHATPGYFIDRWATRSSYLEVTVAHGITFQNTYTDYLYPEQRFAKGTIKAGKTFTGVAYLSDGNVVAQKITAGENSMTPSYIVEHGIQWFISNDNQGYDRAGFFVQPGASVTVLCVALYEGEYTTKNIPAYQPKGYAHELMECMRYYQRFGLEAGSVSFGIAQTTSSANKQVRIFMPTPVAMRKNPTCTIIGGLRATHAISTTVNMVEAVVFAMVLPTGMTVAFTLTDSIESGPYFIATETGGIIEASADF